MVHTHQVKETLPPQPPLLPPALKIRKRKRIMPKKKRTPHKVTYPPEIYLPTSIPTIEIDKLSHLGGTKTGQESMQRPKP